MQRETTLERAHSPAWNLWSMFTNVLSQNLRLGPRIEKKREYTRQFCGSVSTSSVSGSNHCPAAPNTTYFPELSYLGESLHIYWLYCKDFIFITDKLPQFSAPPVQCWSLLVKLPIKSVRLLPVFLSARICDREIVWIFRLTHVYWNNILI